jgi:hypothetical protein
LDAVRDPPVLTLSCKEEREHSPSPQPSPLKGEGDQGKAFHRAREIMETGIERLLAMTENGTFLASALIENGGLRTMSSSSNDAFRAGRGYFP